MIINLNTNQERILAELGAKYYVIRGDPPMTAQQIIDKLIDRAWNQYQPREYVSVQGRE